MASVINVLVMMMESDYFKQLMIKWQYERYEKIIKEIEEELKREEK